MLRHTIQKELATARNATRKQENVDKKRMNTSSPIPKKTPQKILPHISRSPSHKDDNVETEKVQHARKPGKKPEENICPHAGHVEGEGSSPEHQCLSAAFIPRPRAYAFEQAKKENDGFTKIRSISSLSCPLSSSTSACCLCQKDAPCEFGALSFMKAFLPNPCHPPKAPCQDCFNADIDVVNTRPPLMRRSLRNSLPFPLSPSSHYGPQRLTQDTPVKLR